MDALLAIQTELTLLRSKIATVEVDLRAKESTPNIPVAKPVQMRPAFRVKQTSDTTVSVEAGYAQGQTSTVTSVAAVASITISAETYIFARYNLGEAGVSSPGWETVSGSIIQSGSALPTPSDQYRVIPIAHISWSGTYSAIGIITQHHTGMLPCPDMELPGKVVPFNVPHGTVKYGWKPCDGTNSTVDIRKKFISGTHGSGNLAAGSETTTLTAAALNAMDNGHTHPLINVSTDSVQGYDAGNLGAGPIGLEQLDPYTNSPYTALFKDSTDLAIVPPNVAMPYYEHL